MKYRYKTYKSTHDRIYECLKNNPHGATMGMMREQTGLDYNAVSAALPEMYGVYIARYGSASGFGPVNNAIWMAVDVPEDCPMPEGFK